MKNFDTARKEREEADRSFLIGGREFRYRAAVAPESILKWTQFANAGDSENNILLIAQNRLESAKAIDPPYPPSEIAKLESKVMDALEAANATRKTEEQWLGLIDDTVLSIIEPDYVDDWNAVRDPNVVHPLNLQDLQDLIEWLVSQVVGRPTTPPSDSSPSPSTPETSSTDDSSSQEAVASKEDAPQTADSVVVLQPVNLPT